MGLKIKILGFYLALLIICTIYLLIIFNNSDKNVSNFLKAHNKNNY